jgi:hypothetical protein
VFIQLFIFCGCVSKSLTDAFVSESSKRVHLLKNETHMQDTKKHNMQTLLFVL